MRKARPKSLLIQAFLAVLLLLPGNSEAARSATLPKELGNRLGMLFRLIEPGSFEMGSSPQEQKQFAIYNAFNEIYHSVTLTRGYYLQKTEVTQGQWQAVMGTNPSHFKGDPNLPVDSVSWTDAQAFIQRLNARGDGRYRLPTEAEWEYAAWGGDQTDRAGALEQRAWYQENAEASTHPVAAREPNAWGLYDMLGNVWEWVGDYYGNYPAQAVSDPLGPASGKGRVIRGGSWKNVSALVRPPVRCCEGSSPNLRNPDIGFRLVRLP